MKILVLGNSSIVRRRVVPALLAMEEVEKIDLATLRPEAAFALPADRQGRIFSDYSEALEKTTAEWVYISTTNQAHSEWIRKALDSGRHVIVDKPACLNYATAEDLINLADKKSKILAEATVYTYHPQIQKIVDLFSEKNSSCSRLTTQFSVPPFEAGNFRYRKDQGGGALMDLGPYAVSLSRIFFAEEPTDVQCRITSKRGQVDISFSMLLSYSKGQSLLGQFGFDTEYTNHLRLLGPNLCAWADRVFTIGADQSQNIFFRSNNQEGQILVPSADSFCEFLKAVTRAGPAQTVQFKSNLLKDARLLDRMVQNAKKEYQ